MMDRITLDTAICHGNPCIRGLRYPVELILELLSSDMTTEQILADTRTLNGRTSWPYLPSPRGSAR